MFQTDESNRSDAAHQVYQAASQGRTSESAVALESAGTVAPAFPAQATHAANRIAAFLILLSFRFPASAQRYRRSMRS
jgi:hypothetical protein